MVWSPFVLSLGGVVLAILGLVVALLGVLLPLTGLASLWTVGMLVMFTGIVLVGMPFLFRWEAQP